SARSKPPSRRMRVARTRRDSDRYTASTAARPWSTVGSLMGRSSRSGVRQLLHRANFDDSDAHRRKPRGHLARLVHVLGLDEEKPAELLLRLGEGAVGGGDFAALDPDRP